MNMKDVLGLILGGGVGSRLYPLTRDRSKPAVPLAGKYRLIDIPMSNCLHAGIDKIAILTQFNSVSLHRHIYRTYHRDVFSGGWVQILAAEQTPQNADWYQGTADAVRKQLVEIREAGTEYVLILAGDHLYRMDYEKFVDYHVESGADISIAVQPVDRSAASSLGILKLDEESRVVRFTEKPKTEEALAGLESRPDPEKPYMASMGIYVFSTEGLIRILEEDDAIDFGSQIIPARIDTHKVMGYVFDGYWADIGTIERFFEVNLDIAAPLPLFNLYDPDRPIYTRARFLPGSKVEGGHLQNVFLADGCRIQEAAIRNSVVGLRSIISHGVTMQRVVMMGADYYETIEDLQKNREAGIPNIGIAPDSVVEGAIIDKNARIGRQVIIRYQPDRPDEEHDNWASRDGIVIVPKNAVIPPGTVI
ncbi:MAG TPA: glucose-1-phosphate adenylyltransferase [Anaerolineae bacterium]|nr:glucose-1-phosphate adenylyltransferase [Anaerolineae bacterium]